MIGWLRRPIVAFWYQHWAAEHVRAEQLAHHLDHAHTRQELYRLAWTSARRRADEARAEIQRLNAELAGTP